MFHNVIRSHFVYMSRIKYNLPLSLLSQKFLTLPILYRLTVDLISGGQRDSWPCWQEAPTQQFCMDNRAAGDLQMSSAPRVILGNWWWIYNILPSLQICSIPGISFFLPSIFSSISHTQFPLLYVFVCLSISVLVSNVSLSVEAWQMINKWILIFIKIHTPASISFESIVIFHSILTSVTGVTSLTLWRII